MSDNVVNVVKSIHNLVTPDVKQKLLAIYSSVLRLYCLPKDRVSYL